MPIRSNSWPRTARRIGVKVLIENHTGFSADVNKVLTLLKAVNDPNCGAITDWGNSPATTIEERVADMQKLMPYLSLVSAKELEFDANNNHMSYDVVPLIKATEASGYRGIYSIEFYTDKNPAVRSGRRRQEDDGGDRREHQGVGRFEPRGARPCYTASRSRARYIR